MVDGDHGPPGLDADAPLDSAWFERAVEAAGHAIFVTDFDGRIVYVNPAFEEITGYTAADAVGRTPDLLNAGYHTTDYFRRLWATILDGDVWQAEVVNRRADGESYVANQTIAPIVDDGTITHFVAIQTDITERKEHEMALERKQDLSARTEVTADVGGWELDLDAGELRWTAGTRRIHEVDPTYEPSLEAALAFYHPSDREKIQTFVERALEWHLPYDVEARLVTAEGTTRIVRTTGQPVDTESGLFLRGTIQDITERKARRQQLMVFNRVLRHNLRNDLNVVVGNAERLLSAVEAADDGDSVTLPADRARTDLRSIVSAAENLLGVSAQARQFDDIYQQIRDIQPVEVRPLLEAVAAEYRDACPEATVRVEGSNPVVLANRHAVRVAVGELVDNAIEHSTDGHPTVTLGVDEGADGTIRLSVADRGDGIPEMEREVITNGEERPLKHGSGLGLWLVKWLVTPIGGSIEIEDNEPSGAVVSIVFPASRWQPSSQADPASTSTPT
ncbi:PAS domain-containing sensor histidine kinase [Haloplanus aerogenes]|uniref:histidine kinase n=1 Tax=Haloplanus aerogenes TaxID=660522 RepID=A0A3M0CV39_9EURY|nr:PAS domain-containing sensor histidine kinase [Haloplanus aerogenes]AZH26650.1 PAS domain S-box protein [Haloplanus aerogenes]RMB12887.1 PAS domain S-box-containing protein [Haloplanus aerogenes]